jgi:bacterial/archaeal transporter family protein
MTWEWIAILAAILFTGVGILDKYIISKELRDAKLDTSISGIVLAAVLMLVPLIFGKVTSNPYTIIFGLIAGISFAIGYWFYFRALGGGEASRVVPALAFIPLFVLIYAAIFMGERLSLWSYIGIFLMIAGSVLISYKKSKKRISIRKGFMIMLVAALLFSVRNLASKVAVTDSLMSALFWMGLGGMVIYLALFAAHHPHIRKKAKKGVKHLVFGGALFAGAYALLALAFSKGSVSLVSALVEIHGLFTFMVATTITIFYPKIIKEKITKEALIHKGAAIVLIIIGAILII